MESMTDNMVLSEDEMRKLIEDLPSILRELEQERDKTIADN